MSTIHETIRDHGGISSDGPIADSWRHGWATHPFKGRERAHWFTRHTPSQFDHEAIVFRVVSACGKVSTFETKYMKDVVIGVHLLGAGNVPRCKHCARKVRIRAVR